MNSAAFRFILKTSEHGLITQEQSMMCHLAVSVVNENSGDFRWRSAQILQEFAPARMSHSHRHPTIIGEAAGFGKKLKRNWRPTDSRRQKRRSG